MKQLVAVVCIAFLSSCGNNKAEQARQDQLEEDTRINNSHLFYQILKNIDRELPLTFNYRDKLLGGYKDMNLFVDNKTGYTVDKLTVAVQFFRASGELGDEQSVTFINLMPGQTQSQPLKNNDVGTSVRLIWNIIQIKELRQEQEIIATGQVVDPNKPH